MSTVTAEQPTNGKRVRGPNLAVLIKAANGVPFEEGLLRANAENRVIASNERLSRALIGSEEWRSVEGAFACWSGTITGYVTPEKKLGKIVEYADSRTGCRWVFPVPEEYQGKTNAVLVAEHPDYTLEIDGRNRIVRAAQVDLIERFPAENGWYLGDAKHDIPSGKRISMRNPDARYLVRDDAGGVALAIRTYGDHHDIVRRYVDLGVRSSPLRGAARHFGVVVEAP